MDLKSADHISHSAAPSVRKKFLYTICTGRCGTVYLTELIKQNCSESASFHERLGPGHFGIDTPELSQLTAFNMFGVTPALTEFWHRKFEKDQTLGPPFFAETSHLNAKAGLMEHIDLLTQTHAEVHLVILKRDLFKIVWSLHNGFSFFNQSFLWMWYLDPGYQNKILDFRPFQKFGRLGAEIWYVLEMWTRAEYYKRLFISRPNIYFHEITLEDIIKKEGAYRFIESILQKSIDPIRIPTPQNARKTIIMNRDEENRVRSIVDRLSYDCAKAASAFIQAGRRLALGPHQRVPQKSADDPLLSPLNRPAIPLQSRSIDQSHSLRRHRPGPAPSED